LKQKEIEKETVLLRTSSAGKFFLLSTAKQSFAKCWPTEIALLATNKAQQLVCTTLEQTNSQ
jgi:hypothetical protein